MNNQRRKKIRKALGLIGEAHDILEEVRDEEEESYDNLPEKQKEGERGDTMEENISTLEDFIGQLEEADELEEM